jgi:hypothetical protein
MSQFNMRQYCLDVHTNTGDAAHPFMWPCHAGLQHTISTGQSINKTGRRIDLNALESAIQGTGTSQYAGTRTTAHGQPREVIATMEGKNTSGNRTA